MRSTVLLSILNPILSLTLIRRFGSPGAASGTSLALICASIYLLVIFHRYYVENSVWTVLREIYARPIAAGVLANLAVAGFHHAVPVVIAWEESRYLIPLKLAVDVTVFGLIYVVMLVALRQVTAIDWNNFTGFVSFGFEFLRHPFRERV